MNEKCPVCDSPMAKITKYECLRADTHPGYKPSLRLTVSKAPYDERPIIHVENLTPEGRRVDDTYLGPESFLMLDHQTVGPIYLTRREPSLLKTPAVVQKFRKKPVVVEAAQWFKVEYVDVAYNLPPYRLGVGYFRHPDIGGEQTCKHCGAIMHDHGWIDTLEGGHTVCPGDWIITGVKGERYPCKPDIFAATYEPAVFSGANCQVPGCGKPASITRAFTCGHSLCHNHNDTTETPCGACLANTQEGA